MAKKAKDRTNEALMGAAMAFGGGMAGEVIGDLTAKYAPDFVAKNPKLAEAVPAAIGTAGLFFLDDRQYDPIFYGMIGASGAGLGDDIIKMAGFGRTKGRMNGADADEIRSGIEYIEKLQKEGFEPFDNTINGGSQRKGWG